MPNESFDGGFYAAEQGAPLSAKTLALIKLFAPFQRWCRFAWYWGKDEQPDWVWRDNVRPRTVDALLKILTTMEEAPLQ